jgi:hypothetical protein
MQNGFVDSEEAKAEEDKEPGPVGGLERFVFARSERPAGTAREKCSSDGGGASSCQ